MPGSGRHGRRHWEYIIRYPMEDLPEPSGGDNELQAASCSRISPSDDTSTRAPSPAPPMIDKRPCDVLTPSLVTSELAMKRAASEDIMPSQLLHAQSLEPNGSMESLRTIRWEDYGHPSHPTPSSYASLAAQPPTLSITGRSARYFRCNSERHDYIHRPGSTEISVNCGEPSPRLGGGRPAPWSRAERTPFWQGRALYSSLRRTSTLFFGDDFGDNEHWTTGEHSD
ncbi:hypothetical protein EVAR_103361_1 [Eumeta japonica]|uniref:Uncharacterized protein n=1 Tax=Eumeta variegata TaxID=151549 RepID=A0A4C1Y6F4_EUMVA|nr:hypothetical protein EVAR_103361_1 [Eumeta japonica]